MKVKELFSTALLIVTSCSLTALSQETAKAKPFEVCQGTYALCTFSKCEATPGLNTASCSCGVWQGYSVGTECEGPKKNPDGQTTVRSRYYPIPGYARCTNSNPWAMCLDKPCTVDEKDKTRASCDCSVLEGKGDYLVQFECPAGIISSATVLDLDKITDFLETQDKIPVQDFIVLNPRQK
ncbi:MAG TPA: hypothetical protein VKH40_02135 [Alloacidobacterium sp.]|nr:hypothetical protein [Alloacidobacterium sp.]